MSHRGHIEKGVIVVDEPVDLPEGTVVEFRPVSPPPGRHHPDVERFAGIIQGTAEDNDEHMEYLRKKHQ